MNFSFQLRFTCWLSLILNHIMAVVHFQFCENNLLLLSNSLEITLMHNFSSSQYSTPTRANPQIVYWEIEAGPLVKDKIDWFSLDKIPFSKLQWMSLKVLKALLKPHKSFLKLFKLVLYFSNLLQCWGIAKFWENFFEKKIFKAFPHIIMKPSNCFLKKVIRPWLLQF